MGTRVFTKLLPPSQIVPAAGFRVLTPAYDILVRWTTRERAFKHSLVQQVDPRPGQRVLDLACGTGTLALELWRAEPAARLIAIDADRAILTRAQRKTARSCAPIALHGAAAEALPFADRTIDVVVTSLLLHHLEPCQRRLALAEVRRVLRSGGSLHVADWCAPANVLMRCAFQVVRLVDGYNRTRDHARGLIGERIRSAGFVGVEQTRKFATPLGTLALWRASAP